MSQYRVVTGSQFSHDSTNTTSNNNNNNTMLLAGAVGASVLFSGLTMSYYYGKKLKQQQEEFDQKLQLLSKQTQPIQQQNILHSTQFSGRIAPGPVPSLQLSSPAFAPINNQTPAAQHQGSSSNIMGSPMLTPRLQPRRSAIVVVDPVSTGANVAHEVTKRGIPCIRVMSGYVAPALLNLVDESVRTEFVASVNHDSADPYKTVVTLASLPFTIIGILSGSELGVEVTDFLSEQLGCPTNGTELTNARRDKYQMGEAVRRAGVRAVKQARVQSWSELEAFLEDLRPNPFKLVLKPIRSAGSDNVFLCESLEEAKEKFESIIGTQNQLGFLNEAVVVQEYLEGIEYVVDGVSRDGKHKIVAIWDYDKRKFHGVNFVYFGMGSISGKSKIGASLASYMNKVLEALNIRYGASHGEVIMTKTGPCLVEVGARCHGCEGTFMPLADRVWGYNQVGTLVSATISQQEFDQIPDVCGDEKEYGFKVDFVCNTTGKLIGFKHLDDMEKLPSFVQFDVMPKIGDMVHVTIDCFTAVGSCTLVHKNKSQVEADVNQIREWEKEMFVVDNNTEEKQTKTKKAGP